MMDSLLMASQVVIPMAIMVAIGMVLRLVKPMPTAASLGQAIFRSNFLISGVLLRLILVPMAIMPLAILCGFRGQQLCALMILFAAPTAVSRYPMAVAMDADGDFAAQMVAYTTIFCLPTIFLWTLLLNSMCWM